MTRTGAGPQEEQRDNPPASPRKLSRPARRVQLIEATIETLATRGFARTTLTDVARQAGLSHGLVNFHFQSKEKLLAETLLYLADEYRTNWQASLSAASPTPAGQLDAMLRADFNPQVSSPGRLYARCSLRGEAQTRPIYHDKCGSNDKACIGTMEDICSRLMAEGAYGGSAARTARVLRLTVEGVLLDRIATNAPYDLAEALATVHVSAQAFFPGHFGPEGLIGQ